MRPAAADLTIALPAGDSERRILPAIQIVYLPEYVPAKRSKQLLVIRRLPEDVLLTWCSPGACPSHDPHDTVSRLSRRARQRRWERCTIRVTKDAASSSSRCSSRQLRCDSWEIIRPKGTACS